jgi:MFS family permease
VILSRRQVRLLIPLGTALALSLPGDSTVYTVLANQIEVVGISLGVVGVLLGANRLIRVPGNLLAGALNDRLGRRRLFLSGLFLGMLSTFSYGLARGFWPLLAGRLLWGIAWSLINVGGYTMILDYSTPADRGRMAGFYQLAFMLGLAVSPTLGGALTDALGFRLAVRICGTVTGLGLLIALVALPETRPATGPSRALTWHAWQRVPRQWLVGLGISLRKLDRGVLLAAYIYLVTFFVSSGVLISTIGLFVGRRWAEGIAWGGVAIGVALLAGVMLAMRAFLGMVAGPVAGALSDRLGNRWPVVRGGILVGVVGFVILALPGGLGAMSAGVALIALSAAALAATLAALVGDLAVGNRSGVTMGGLATAGDLGSSAGPLVAYALAPVLDLRWIYLFCAVALASGLIATIGQGQRDPENS